MDTGVGPRVARFVETDASASLRSPIDQPRGQDAVQSVGWQHDVGRRARRVCHVTSSVIVAVVVFSISLVASSYHGKCVLKCPHYFSVNDNHQPFHLPCVNHPCSYYNLPLFSICESMQLEID